MAKPATLWTVRAPAISKPIDLVKWMTWSLWALAAALVIAGIAFLSGYLFGVHSAIVTIRHDQAMIVHLNNLLQATHLSGH